MTDTYPTTQPVELDRVLVFLDETTRPATRLRVTDDDLQEVVLDGMKDSIFVRAELIGHMSYDVTIPYCWEEGPPEQAALAMLAWIRDPMIDIADLTVVSHPDSMRYAVSCRRDDSGVWTAQIEEARREPRLGSSIPRPDLVPDYESGAAQ